MIAGVCRGCGCTDERGCIVDGAGQVVDVLGPEGVIGDGTLPDGYTVCHWIEPDLCSACVEGAAPPMLFDAAGNPIGRAP
jgi:hypothetical protein